MDKLNMNTVTVQCGVDYATVESRVRAFCSEHQNGQILTEMVKCEDDTGEVIFRHSLSLMELSEVLVTLRK